LVDVPTLTDIEQLADASDATWHDIWIALTPVVGAAGVAALFQRSLFLRAVEYRWLANVSEPSLHGEFDTLRAELLQQTVAEAAAANDALLQTLVQVLGTLIGASLTTRLLQPVWEKHGRSTQDKSVT
jgi:hypothetical protein